MNRTDRLLAIVLELQGGGRRTAERLARTFEVSVRTIYRDLRALEGAGVPLVAAPGQGYWLMEGYFLPPLHVTGEEATLLLLGLDVMAQSFDEDFRRTARSAERKIEGVLAPEQRSEVAYLRDNIAFISNDHPTGDAVEDALATLRRALVERRRVRFGYRKRHGGGEAEGRIVDPHALFRLTGVWMLSGWSHLRGDMRTFRLDRMEGVTLTDERFERRTEGQAHPISAEGRSLRVVARFDTPDERWVRESHSYYITERRRTPEGLMVTLEARRVDEVLPWLLSWGSAVTVLEPASVRERLRDEGARLAARYTEAAAAD